MVIESYINGLIGVLDSVIVPLRINGQSEDLIVCFVRVTNETNFDDLIVLIKTNLPTLYRPEQIISYKSNFPYSANGKINRRKLIALANKLLSQNRNKGVKEIGD